VIRKVKESEEITSFYLQPEDREFIPSFQPGQFLPIKLDIPEQPKPILRTYSLSDYPAPCDYYRLSIKRESAPAHLNVPPGVASNFMHEHINEGSVILAKPPTGNFILDLQKSLPAVLISNGVGITPMVSMAKAVTHLNRDRPLWFFHGARDGRFHAFRDEISQIAAQNPNLQIHFAYSRPRPEDRGQYHSEGYIDVDLLRSLITEDAEYFLCGSPPFMDSIRQGLREHGIPDHRVYFEMFSKAPPTQSSQFVTVRTVAGGAEVVFQQSGKTESWQDTADNLLEFAEDQGLNPPYSCRQGICGTCECRLLEGEVGYSAPPTAAIAEGSVLICIARPKTNRVVLDL
jgi:ferredoxin-NADP reductase